MSARDDVMDLLRAAAREVHEAGEVYGLQEYPIKQTDGTFSRGAIKNARGWVTCLEVQEVIDGRDDGLWAVMDAMRKEQLAERRVYERRVPNLPGRLITETERVAFRLHPLAYMREFGDARVPSAA